MRPLGAPKGLPFGNLCLRFYAFFFICYGGMPAGMAGAFRSPLHPSGTLFSFWLSLLGKRACLRAWQGLSARPCILRGRLVTRLERARGSPWVQESSPRSRAKDVGLVYIGSARGNIGPQSCPPAGDPSRVPACLVSWRQGKFATHGGFNSRHPALVSSVLASSNSL